MNKTFIYLFLILLNISSAAADNYFVRLSTSGLKYRNDLLAQNFQNIPILTSVSLKKTISAQIQSVTKQNRYNDFFNKWVITSTDSAFINELKTSGIADYYEKIGHFKVELFDINGEDYTQYYLKTIDTDGAWKVTRGNNNIIIGLIDTGVDYTHPDLTKSLWINHKEDLNGNGRLDSLDLNGIDDDGNGFIDDVAGWDFTDAPDFPDGGDYQIPDNDPMDEFRSGHGTQIAGIISGNDISGNGFMGIAPEVRVMNLRAGTASGYLEEDDVAQAIFYALDNGASIINMSFGDVVLSRFLKDVIHYAYENGIIFVASSGNSGTDEIHYPSGLSETISVGASTKDNFIAGFSNFGNTLDLVAPGSDILSTAIGGEYNVVSGTSFSTPMVSAVCGLLKSQFPDYSNERIRNIIKSTTTDIMNSGWDIYSAAGLISAGKALKVTEAGILTLLHPGANSSVATDTLWLVGSTVHPDLKSVIIEYGIGKDPDSWVSINTWNQRQVFNDTLGFVNLNGIADTVITIRLQMSLISGQMDEHRTLVHIDRTPPVITNNTVTYLYDSTEESVLISFETDDVCKARLNIREKNSDLWLENINLAYETDRHRIKLNRSVYEGAYEYYIEVENLSGLYSKDENNGQLYSFNLKPEFEWQDFIAVPWSIPAGYMLDKAVDLDHDGKKEIVISRYNENHGFGPIEIYEFNNGEFSLVLKTSFTAIPRDAGDVDGDGLSDLLLGYGKNTFLLESKSPDQFPSEIVWSDTLDFWGAGYGDADSDGKMEIIGRNDSSYIVLENVGDNTFTETARLKNNTKGDNVLSFPQFRILDINNNGRLEITYTDEDGDLLFFESTANNSFIELNTVEEENAQSDNFIQVLKQTTGNDFLFKVSHTSESLNYEHEFDGRFWQIIKYGYEVAAPVALDTINIFGYQTLKEYNSSIQASTIEGEDYLFASLYPDFYIFKIDNRTAVPVWHTQTARSNAIIIDDFDNDGHAEFYFNNGEKISAFCKTLVERTSKPYFFKVEPLDSNRTRLSWGKSSGAQYYNIYRGSDKESMQFIDTSQVLYYSDSSLIVDSVYYYAVSAIDVSQSIPESWKSSIDSVIMGYPPKLIDAVSVNDREIILTFNEIIAFKSEIPVKIKLKNSGLNAVSSIILKEKNKLLVGFDKSFVPGESDTVFVEGVYNLKKTPLDIKYNTQPFIFKGNQQEPYVDGVEIVDRYHIRIRFNQPMLRSSLLSIDNYSLEPSGSVLAVLVEDSLNKQILVSLDKESLAGALGKAGYLIMNNIESSDRVLLIESNKINLYKDVDDLDNILIYPQPVRPLHQEVIFAKLPKDVEIDIFNLSGIRIRSLKENSQYGGIRWNLRDDNGYYIRSGIYFFEIRSNESKKLGKIVIMR